VFNTSVGISEPGAAGQTLKVVRVEKLE